MINHMSHALAGLPAVRAFLQRVDDGVVLGDYSSFWRAVDGFSILEDRRVWQTFYAAVVEKVASDPTYNGGRDWGVHGFVICESDKFHFSVRSTMGSSVGRNVVDARRTQLASVASTMTAPSVLLVASDAAVKFNVFRLPADVDLDIFDPISNIQICEPVSVQPWTRVDVNAPRETLELSAGPGDEYCIVELAMRSTITQRWEFDRYDGTPIGAVLVSRDAVVLRSMLDEISRFKYEPALGEVLQLTSHGDFNVRWAAIRCAWEIDPGVGRASIEGAVRDSHPYVRRAALAALRNLRNGDHGAY